METFRETVRKLASKMMETFGVKKDGGVSLFIMNVSHILQIVMPF